MSFSTTPKSWAITAKISRIGPWVGRIDWCKDHWWGSTYMAVRLSDIRPKTGKICIFCVFRLFLSLCQTVSQPYRLSHTNVLHINQFHWSKNQSIKFSQKNIGNCWAVKRATPENRISFICYPTYLPLKKIVVRSKVVD